MTYKGPQNAQQETAQQQKSVKVAFSQKKAEKHKFLKKKSLALKGKSSQAKAAGDGGVRTAVEGGEE